MFEVFWSDTGSKVKRTICVDGLLNNRDATYNMIWCIKEIYSRVAIVIRMIESSKEKKN